MEIKIIKAVTVTARQEIRAQAQISVKHVGYQSVNNVT